MTTCRHDDRRKPGAANRLILSRLGDPDRPIRRELNDAQDAVDVLADEIADCPGCWQAIAVYCAALAAEHLTEACGGDEAEAIAFTEDRIIRALDN